MNPKRMVFATADMLRRRVSIDEVEAKYAFEGKPFGGRYAPWERLKAQVSEGDELWEFSNSADAWEALCGIAGIALVRKGEIVYTIVTEKS